MGDIYRAYGRIAENAERIFKRSRDVLGDLGDEVRQHMYRRIRQGRDRHGVPMAPYAKSTQKRKGVSATPVFLVDTGDMLGAIQVRRRENVSTLTVQVFIDTDQFPHARYLIEGFVHHKSGRFVPPREWFGVTPSAQQRLRARFDTEVFGALEDRGDRFRIKTRWRF